MRCILIGTIAALGWIAFVPCGEARAEEAWEAEVEAARKTQDKELRAAKRQGSIKSVVITYQSRHQRSPTVLNKYLLARVLYYDKRANDAARLLKECLRANADFWFANLNLAILAYEQQKYEYALTYIDRVLRMRPKELPAIELRTQILLSKGDMGPAINALQDLLEIDPGNNSIRVALARAYARTKQLESAERELLAVKKALPGDMEVLEFLGMVQLELAKYTEAARSLERVVYMNDKAVHVMQALEVVYVQLEDRKRLIRNYERLIPLMRDAEIKERLKQRVAELESGAPIKRPAQPASPKFPDDPFAQLLERCVSDDVEVRRKALHEYYEARIPVVHSLLYARIEPRLEPDPECRVLLVRILGSLNALPVVRHIARALADPAAGVRAIAAEELGRLKFDAAVLYLYEHLFAVKLSPPPPEGEAREAVEREFNAVRLALREYAEFQDQPISAPQWVTLDRATEVRERWRAFLDTSAGVELKMRAIDAFLEVDEPQPERTLTLRIFDKSPKVALAAYATTLRHADRLAATEAEELAFYRERWATFPRVEASLRTPEGLPEIRKQVRGWYEARRKAAQANSGN